MSRPIDEKIVRMTLDNARFKDNVKETVSAFDSINQATQNTGNIDLSNIAKSLSTIESRFSATGAAIASIIKNIVDSAMAMSKQLYSAVTAPLIEGGKKRALNIEQAQFQFEGLGMDVEKTMKSALEAVKGTAFGLDEAAVVAAQFGATGMRAGDEMTSALRGISGVAAMTGSSYSDVGQIFTVVAGNGRLMSNELLRLSSRGINAAATLAKAFDMTEADVREMVTAGEVSFEMFANAMSEAFGEHATRANETFSGSLSNLRAALSRIGASIYTPRYEQLRDIINATTPVVDALGEALEPLIDSFNVWSRMKFDSLIDMLNNIDFSKFVELGGIENLVVSFWDVMDGGSAILSSVANGFRQIFPKMTVERLVQLTEGFSNLTSYLVFSTETTEKFTTIFAGVFSIFSTVFELAKVLGEAIFGIIPEGTGGNVLDFLVYIAEMAIAFNESVKEGNMLTEFLTDLGGALRVTVDVIAAVLSGTINLAKAIGDRLGPMFEWLLGVLKPIGDAIKEALGDDPLSAENILSGGLVFGIIVIVQKIYDMFLKFSMLLEGLSFNIAQTFRRMGTALGKFIGEVKYNTLMKIAISIGILAISMKVLETMSFVDVAKGLGALAGGMAILSAGMLLIEKLSFTGGIRAGLTIIAMAIALSILSTTLKRISDLDPDEIGRGIGGLIGMMATLALGFIAISKLGGKIKTGSLQMIAFATAILILVSALERLSVIPTAELFTSIGALALIFTALAGFMLLTKNTKIGPGTALGLMGIAAAMIIMATGIQKIADIDTEDLIKGLIGVAAILLQVGLFSKLAGGGQMLLAGVGITILAVALNMLMIPITRMSKMSWEDLAKGLVGLAGALGAVALIGSLASTSILGAIGITLMAVALNMLMPPILIFSSMSWGSILKGVGGLAIALAALALTSMLLTPAIVPMLGFGVALLAMGAAVALAGAGIALFGTGLATLAAMTAGSVVAIIGSLGMFIRGLGSIIVDVVDFVVRLGSALIGGIGKLVPQLITVAADIIMTLVRTLGNNTQDFVEAGYDIIIGLIKGIGEKYPELADAGLETIASILNGMADALENNGGDIVDAFIRLMGEVIIVVIDAGIGMIEALFGWIPGIKSATADIGETAEEYIRANFGARELADEKMDEFSSGMTSKSGDVNKAALSVAEGAHTSFDSVDFTNLGQFGMQDYSFGINSQTGLVETSAMDIATAGNFSMGKVDHTSTGSSKVTQYVSGMTAERKTVEKAAKEMSDAGKTSAEKTNYKPVGSDASVELAEGMESKKKTVETSAKSIGNAAGGAFGSVGWYSYGSNATTSFSNGISSKRQTVLNASRGIASAASGALGATLMIRSPSKVTTRFGEFFGDGFVEGIVSRTKNVVSKAKEMAVRASTALRDSLGDLQPEDDEIRLKVIIDDDDFDPDNFDIDPIDFRPNPGYTTGLVETADDGFRQNRNINNEKPTSESTTYNEYKYEIGVTAGGNMSKAEVKKLAKDVQTEIKNDRDKMGRGEAVIF